MATRRIVKYNPTLAGVTDTVDFNERRNDKREISDGEECQDCACGSFSRRGSIGRARAGPE